MSRRSAVFAAHKKTAWKKKDPCQPVPEIFQIVVRDQVDPKGCLGAGHHIKQAPVTVTEDGRKRMGAAQDDGIDVGVLCLLQRLHWFHTYRYDRPVRRCNIYNALYII